MLNQSQNYCKNDKDSIFTILKDPIYISHRIKNKF